MKKILVSISLSLLSLITFSQEVTGYWKTVDDETGRTRSVVHIFEDDDNSIDGKIIKLFQEPHEVQDPKCMECPKDDARHGQKVIGMQIITSLEKDGNVCSGGEIMDPKNGKSYRCKIWTEGNDILKVRGYVGPFYRTQTWHRTTSEASADR